MKKLELINISELSMITGDASFDFGTDEYDETEEEREELTTDEKEEILIYQLGADGLLGELLRAMGTQEKEEYFSFIARMHDIEL